MQKHALLQYTWRARFIAIHQFGVRALRTTFLKCTAHVLNKTHVVEFTLLGHVLEFASCKLQAVVYNNYTQTLKYNSEHATLFIIHIIYITQYTFIHYTLTNLCPTKVRFLFSVSLPSVCATLSLYFCKCGGFGQWESSIVHNSSCFCILLAESVLCTETTRILH